MSGLGGTKPERSACLLDGTGESAVVDDLAADGFDAASCGESCGTNEHAASSGSGCGAPAIANPCRRVEHEEEENECGNQPALEPGFAVELHHERGEVGAILFGERDKVRELLGACSMSASVSRR